MEDIDRILSGEDDVSDDLFRLFARLIEQESGIHLPVAKKPLLTRRLRPRLRALGLSSFHKYHRLVKRDRVERIQMIDCISTNETRFFREPGQFDFLREQVIPEWIAEAEEGLRPRSLRIWSAACSTGEEPFSVAMALDSALPRWPPWTVDILASDISTRVLAQAQSAVWDRRRAEAIPEAFLRSYMLEGVDHNEGTIKARRRVRAMIRFARINLLEPGLPGGPQFDLILCRNALIYFATETKRTVVHTLLDRLAPNGLLFVGHAESLTTLLSRVRPVAPNIYRLREEQKQPVGTLPASPAFVGAGPRNHNK